ncbi:alpha/beta hydrolase [Lacimicrobium alkaliphilum]|uniref:Alpha/beta hydrolase n=1 Tax=Lacimicrobium alkaliphilum TaxID=1526571 RepID=A0A0U3B261_9ALTE|nr:alpha/beta hydrolase [Lacimicrobium alkaliphilum]
MINRLTVLPGLLLLLLLSGHVTASDQSGKKTENESPITFTANDGQSTEAFEGYFSVPENRNSPDSRKLKIHYVRFPALTDNPGAPIVYLAGGPGGSGIATSKWRRYGLFQSLRQYGDVIALDQRGTGKSEDVPVCESSQIMHTHKRWDEQSMAALYRQAFSECMNFWQEQGADITGYTTVQNALDIDALRAHLGAEKVTLWGISYGSHLALASLNLFPEKIDKVIIASAEGLDQTVKLPARTDDYFTRLQQVIDQQPGLKAQFPDIIATMHRVHAQLSAEPIRIKVPVKQGEPMDFLFQPVHLQILASMTIADPGSYVGMLLGLYHSLDKGDTRMLQGVLSRNLLNNEPIKMRIMPTAMDIASGISAARLKQVKEQAKQSLLGGILNFPMPHLAGVYKPLDLGDSFRQDPVGDVPVLLLTGTLDGRTYPAGQAEAVAGLTNLTQVMVVNAGHNLYTSSPEVLTAMKYFLAQGKTKTRQIELPLPDFDL